MDQVVIKYKNSAGKQKEWDEVQCSGQMTGLELKKILSSKCQIPVDNMKVLCAGKYLQDNLTVSEQKLGSNSKLLIQYKRSEEEQQKITEKIEQAEKTSRLVKAAEVVASRTDESDDKYYFEVENQDGVGLNINGEDKKLLIVAMSLHEKGQKMITKEKIMMSNNTNIETGIKLLYEADNNFLKIKDESLLKKIDNYARLNLDILWGLLKSGNNKELHNEYQRLDVADRFFKSAYGEKNERLIQFKGEFNPESIVYVRINLLKAIFAIEKGDINVAKRYMYESENQIKELSISEDLIVPLLNMGFDTKESRIALRSTKKNIDRAIQWLIEYNEKKQEKQRKRIELKQQRKLQRSFGKTKGGQWIDLNHLNNLKLWGYQENISVQALKQTDNDIHLALNLLNEKSYLDLLKLANKDNNNKKKTNNKKKKNNNNIVINESDVQILVRTYGFPENLSRGTLRKAMGNMDRATNMILDGEGVEEEEEYFMDGEEQITSDHNKEEEEEEEGTNKEDEAERIRREKEESELREAESDLISDLNNNDDDDDDDNQEMEELSHLDLDLDEESYFYQLYLSKLTNINT
eukprot:TRINITY_DN4155_c0_g1_i3.p1 TRINITY_DN4155_c0_g1~~TRINITY_DN4155_c0_g1_i3.p1  ORF type:complete len:579 (+),score=169.03 TRINITY_DN4155_c0_g1_i3:63-1799(+)